MLTDSGTPSLPELRVAVIAADPLARAGLANLLEEQEGLRVVARLDLDQLDWAGLTERSAEALLLDLGWGVEGDLSPVEGWLEGEIPLLLLVPSDLPPGPIWGLGSRGMLSRDRPPAAIVAAVRAAVEGLYVLDPDFARPAVRALEGRTALESLTPREIEVLQLLAGGRSNRAIAHELSISEHTVKFHVTSILGKLGAESRTEAAVLAARAGLIVI